VAKAISERQTFHGALHLCPSGALFIGADMVNEPHRHFTVSILIGIDQQIRFRAGGRAWASAAAVMVAPNVEQQLDARGSKIAILQVDPESDEFVRVAHHFEGGKVRLLSDDTVSRLREALRSAGVAAGALPTAELRAEIIDHLESRGAVRRPIDPRIRKVLGIIKADFLAPPPAPELASAVGLSAGRLIHLFTQEMGLPIRRYVLWLRLRDVMFSLAAGHSLTEAAHRAGFADSPHLSRTFRGMFGFPPSAISEGRGRVRIVFDPEAAVAEPGAHPVIDVERLERARGTAGQP
jgi:AraC-like DNA-binding protein